MMVILRNTILIACCAALLAFAAGCPQQGTDDSGGDAGSGSDSTPASTNGDDSSDTAGGENPCNPCGDDASADGSDPRGDFAGSVGEGSENPCAETDNPCNPCGEAANPCGEATEPAATAEVPNPKPDGIDWIWTGKLEYLVGNKITVEMGPVSTEDGNPWIALIPAEVTATDERSNDQADIAYAYVRNAKDGKVELDAADVGEYRLRLISGTGSEGKLLHETPVINIYHWPKGRNDGSTSAPPYLVLVGNETADMPEYAAGSKVKALFEIPTGYSERGWIAMVPAWVGTMNEHENNKHDVSYVYLKDRLKAEVELDAKEPGEYVLRLFPVNANNCEAVAWTQTFVVTE